MMRTLQCTCATCLISIGLTSLPPSARPTARYGGDVKKNLNVS